MPNWCENKLTVIGDHDMVMTFICQARGEYQHYAPSFYEVEWEKRRKEHCEKTGEPFESDAERHKKHIDFSFHQLVPIPDDVMEKQYDPYGYDTEKKLWGIKWGASRARLVSFKDNVANYTYHTPWAPGELFLITLANKWSDLTFALSFREEYPTRGRFLFKEGKLVEKIYEQPPNGRLQRWSNFYYRTHDKWVRELVK